MSTVPRMRNSAQGSRSQCLMLSFPREEEQLIWFASMKWTCCRSLSLCFSLWNPTAYREGGFIPAVSHVIKLVKQAVLLSLQTSRGFVCCLFGGNGNGVTSIQRNLSRTIRTYLSYVLHYCFYQ